MSDTINPEDVEQTRDYYVSEARSAGVDDSVIDGFEDLMSHVAESIKYTSSEPQTQSWVRQMEGWVARIYAAIHDVPLQTAYYVLDETGYIIHTYRGVPDFVSLGDIPDSDLLMDRAE